MLADAAALVLDAHKIKSAAGMHRIKLRRELVISIASLQRFRVAICRSDTTITLSRAWRYCVPAFQFPLFCQSSAQTNYSWPGLDRAPLADPSCRAPAAAPARGCFFDRPPNPFWVYLAVSAWEAAILKAGQ